MFSLKITSQKTFKIPKFFIGWIPVIGYPRDVHVNYMRINGLLRNVFYSFQNLRKALSTDVFAQKKFLDDIFNSEILLQIRLISNWTSCRTIQGVIVLIIF